MQVSNFRNVLAAIVSAGVLSACTSSDSPLSQAGICSDCAVLSTVASDFGSSAVDFVATTQDFEASIDRSAQDLSDVRFTTFGDHFYRIGRGSTSSLAKFSFSDSETPIWEYSVGTSVNPYDVVFVSETKAYVLLWQSNEILEIDPSVTDSSQAASFNVDQIDLSVYDFGLGLTAATGFEKDGLLYVLLEGLDASYVPQTSRLVVIDTSTNTEVDVNGAAAGNAFDLTVKNAGDMDLFGTDLYVAGKGRYGSPAELTGGIEKIDISDATFTSALLVDDDNANVGAQIIELEIASATKGYLTRYNAYQDVDIIQFNATTGVVESTPMTDYTAANIGAIEIDDANQLWIGIGSASIPTLDIISTIDDLQVVQVNTSRNVAAIKFASTTN